MLSFYGEPVSVARQRLILEMPGHMGEGSLNYLNNGIQISAQNRGFPNANSFPSNLLRNDRGIHPCDYLSPRDNTSISG